MKNSTIKDEALVTQDLEACNLILYHTEDNLLALRKERYTK